MDRLTILLLGKSRKCFLETETFKTIQIFFQNFSTWKNIGGEGGERRRDTRRRCEILWIPVVLDSGWFLRYRFTIFFLFFLYFFHFSFRAPPLPPPPRLVSLGCRGENGCRDLKVSITVYNNYRCFKKIWLLSLFRSLLRAPFLRLIVFKHRAALPKIENTTSNNTFFSFFLFLFQNRNIFQQLLNNSQSFDSRICSNTKSSDSNCLSSRTMIDGGNSLDILNNISLSLSSLRREREGRESVE